VFASVFLVCGAVLKNLGIAQQRLQLSESLFYTFEFIKHNATFDADVTALVPAPPLESAKPKEMQDAQLWIAEALTASSCRPNGSDSLMGPKIPALKTEQLLILKLGVLFTKTVDSAGRIHQFLLSGKKRMALGTNFHANILFGGPNLYGATTGTLDGRLCVFWMNVFFHYNFNLLYKLCVHRIQKILIIFGSVHFIK
jgi:hypothetical protein